MADCVHQQVQRRIGSVDEQQCAVGDTVSQRRQVLIEEVGAVALQVEVVREGLCPRGNQPGRVDRVRALQVLSQIPLQPREVVFEGAGILVGGREHANSLFEVLGQWFHGQQTRFTIDGPEVDRVLVADRRCVPVGIQQRRQYPVLRQVRLRRRTRFTVVKTAQYVDEVCRGWRFRWILDSALLAI